MYHQFEWVRKLLLPSLGSRKFEIESRDIKQKTIDGALKALVNVKNPSKQCASSFSEL